MKQEFPAVGIYKVMVKCITYNQSHYIEETLKGFAMQQTGFNYICCIYDDASTDGEQNVLKLWIENHCNPEDVMVYDHPLTVILVAPDKDNHNCNYAVHLQKVNTWGKPEKQELMTYWEKRCEYVALCEGDDYWIDPNKLQKQVDFLDAHKDYVLSHTSFTYKIEYKNNLLREAKQEKELNISIQSTDHSNIVAHIIDYNKYRIQTNTVVFRTDAYFKVLTTRKEQNEPSFMMGDTPLWLRLLEHGNFHFLEDNTAVYRQHYGSVCRSISKIDQIRFALSCAEMRLYFTRLYELPKPYKRKFLKEYKRLIFCYKLYVKEYSPSIYANDILFDKFIMSNGFLKIIKPLYRIYQSDIVVGLKRLLKF